MKLTAIFLLQFPRHWQQTWVKITSAYHPYQKHTEYQALDWDGSFLLINRCKTFFLRQRSKFIFAILLWMKKFATNFFYKKKNILLPFCVMRKQISIC